MNNVLLVVDDDPQLREVVCRAMLKRGFDTVAVASVGAAKVLLQERRIGHAIIDYRLEDGDGISLINDIHEQYPECRAVLLTGYANLPSTVAAIKAGAIDCLPKPCDADDLENALRANDGEAPQPVSKSINADTIRMAHIFNTYKQFGGNVSETARRLGMHRRTLQRILSKSGINQHSPIEQFIGDTEKEIIA